MEFEAPARDFSRLSVSQNPEPPSRTPEPIDFSQLSGSIAFTTGTKGTKFDGTVGNLVHKHLIVFEGNKFTVDGGPERDVNDHGNFKFLESIRNYRIPEEFVEDGLHTIQVVRAWIAVKKDAPEFVVDKHFEEYLNLMGCGIKM